MTCNACGRTSMNEHANFCDYCGTSLKDAVYIESQQAVKEKTNQGIEDKKEGKEISFINWAGTLLLPLIPIIGPIVYFILMLVWSFSKNTNKTKKNWARASLIVGVLIIIIVIYIMVDSYVDLTTKGFDFNTYMNDMMQYY